jgi:hypothetical protein
VQTLNAFRRRAGRKPHNGAEPGIRLRGGDGSQGGSWTSGHENFRKKSKSRNRRS